MALQDFFPNMGALWVDKTTFLPSAAPVNQKVVATEVNQIRDALYDVRTGLVAVTALADVQIYVDATLGNDANSGTASFPLKTFDAALTKLPTFWKGKCRIYLAAGAYSMATTDVNLGGPLGPVAEPFFIIGPMVDSGLGTVTDTGGSTSSVINGGSGMVVDHYRGARIRWLTGPQAGQTRTVLNNTATTFTLQSILYGSLPLVSNTFVLERPGATIASRNSTYGNSFSISTLGPYAAVGANIAMYGIKWLLHPSTGPVYFQGPQTCLWMDACEVDLGNIHNNAFWFQFGARLIMIGAGGYWPTVSNSSATTACYLFNGNNVTNFDDPHKVGVVFSKYATCNALYAVIDTGSVHVLMHSVVVSTAVNIKNGGILFEDGSTGSYVGGVIDGGGTWSKLLYIRKGSAVSTISGLVLQNSTSDAVVVDNSTLGGVSGITGSGNAGYGIRLVASATMVATSACTVTGAADIIVGATVSTHANLTSLGFVTDANFLSRISRT